MYTSINFKTKKALKEALASGDRIEVYQPGPFKPQWMPDVEYSASLEGPHYPEPHRWYASAKICNGCVVPGSVK